MMASQLILYILMMGIGPVLVQGQTEKLETVPSQCAEVDPELRGLMEIEIKSWNLDRKVSEKLEPPNGESITESVKESLLNYYNQERQTLQSIANYINKEFDKKIQECLKVSTIIGTATGEYGKNQLEKDYRKVKSELHRLYQEYIKKFIHPDNLSTEEIDEMDKKTMNLYIPKFKELKIEERMLQSARKQLQSTQ